MRRLTDDQAARYLDVLGIARRAPSHAALAELLAAHLARVPFENVSKLVRAHRRLPPGLPSCDEFLDAARREGLGGTCYLLNPLVGGLLRTLGYRCVLRGADMDQPDVHVVNAVELEGRSWLVDLGYAAPFFAPLPLDARGEVRVGHGSDDYVLHPRDAAGRSRMDRMRGGEVVHGYTITPGARRAEEFTPAVEDSYRPCSTFLNQLYIVRHRPERSVALRDFRYSVVEDGQRAEHDLPDRAAVREFVIEEFDIAPASLDEALAELASRSEAWRDS